jgi:ribonuclease Z
MSWLVQARLINGPFDDPGLFVDFRFGRRAILFDLGDISVLSSRELLRVSHACVSHTHLDHFIGFDRLLRVRLHQTEPLHLFGPAGLADHVAAKLGGYAWNLLDETSPDFVISVSESAGARIVRACTFRACRKFRCEETKPPDLPPGLLLTEDELSIEATELDHGIPCLAFALQETLRVNVSKDGLKALGLPVGPWLNAAKRAVRSGADDNMPVEVPGGTMPLGRLKQSAFRVAEGQRIVYVTDAAGTPANLEKIAAVAKGADQLFIEAAFLAADSDLAAERHHLTAATAGTIARRAGAKRVVPFHFSNRYEEREEDVRREVQDAFSGNAS